MGLHDRTLTTTTSEPAFEAAAVLHAGRAVREFLVYLKANPITDTVILDGDELPLSKATIVNAFRLLIAYETRMEQRAQLQKVGLLLAQFQGVADQGTINQLPEDPLESWIDTVADEPSSNENLWLAAYREQEELKQLFDASARMAERRADVHSSDAEIQSGHSLPN
ncbi:hypothetical protein [Rhizobium sp. HT1-10]|uniref:hypothetical protein n=1 Tax=Rhizobium sp. HT1-10 TaxID=3111638 RepID=UPI003C16345D